MPPSSTIIPITFTHNYWDHITVARGALNELSHLLVRADQTCPPKLWLFWAGFAPLGQLHLHLQAEVQSTQASNTRKTIYWNYYKQVHVKGQWSRTFLSPTHNKMSLFQFTFQSPNIIILTWMSLQAIQLLKIIKKSSSVQKTSLFSCLRTWEEIFKI